MTGRYDNPFDVVTHDGRVVAEAHDLPSARRACEVLLAEENEPALDVKHATGEHVGTYTVGEHGAVWRSSTIARRFN